MTTKSYKIVCKPLDMVLLVRTLSYKEEISFFSDIKEQINRAARPVTINSYMSHVLKHLLVDSEKFFDHFTTEDDLSEEDRAEIIKVVYECIIELYPPLSLEYVCDDLNSTLFSESVPELFKELFKKNPFLSQKSNKRLRTLRDITMCEKFLNKSIVGQKEAVTSIIKAIKVMVSGLTDFSSFFFIGPTGVGKTAISKCLGEQFSGNFYKINCGEYQSGHEYAKLIGSPPGYVGHTEKSLLAEKAEESNAWVFLFDEIEKAHPKFYDFLLSLLDDGTITDNMGKTLDFSQSMFIFTSNQGIRDLKTGKQLGFGDDVRTVSDSEEEIFESVKKHFSPEFLNRIDNYIFFNSLGTDDLRKVASLELKNIPIKKTKSLLKFIVDGGYSEEYGARNIARFIKSNVSSVVAELILAKKVPEKDKKLYTPKIVNGELQIVDIEEDNDGKIKNERSGSA